MKIALELEDVACLAFLKAFEDGLPSLNPQERARRAKELGAEPLCKENLHERVFIVGLNTFRKDIESPGAAMFSTVVKSEALSAFTRIARVLIERYTVHNAKLEALRRERGSDSPEYKAQAHYLSGVIDVVAHLDCEELTGPKKKGERLLDVLKRPQQAKGKKRRKG